MLSLLYLPSLIFNIVYNYLNPPQDEEKPKKQGNRSKYSSPEPSPLPEMIKPGLKQSIKEITPNLEPNSETVKPELEKSDREILRAEHIEVEHEISSTVEAKSPDIINITKEDESPQLLSEDVPSSAPVEDEIPSALLEDEVPQLLCEAPVEDEIPSALLGDEVPQLLCEAPVEDEIPPLSCGEDSSSAEKEKLSSAPLNSTYTLDPQDESSTPSIVHATTAPTKPKVIIALSESDSDDDVVNEFLADVVSVEPSTAKQDIPTTDFTAVDAFSLPSNPAEYQPQYTKENNHVIIEDDVDEDFPSISISVPFITPNSFTNVSLPPPTTQSFDGRSSSSPDTELPGYNGSLDQLDKSVTNTTDGVPSESPTFGEQDVSGKAVSFEEEESVVGKSSVSSGNGAAAVNGGDDMWGDEPVEPISLTSQKHGDIKKYVPKEKQKRVRSDPEWVQYMEKCMLAGARGKVLNSFRQCYREAFDTYRLSCDLLITFGITHASGRTVFQRAALDELRLWKLDTVAPRPSISNQLKALDVSYLCNASLFPTIRDIFELETVPPHEGVMFVQDKLDHKKTKYLKHMALVITELKLQEYFDTAEMLLPLLGMDKLMTIEAYLCNKTLATTFVRALDDLLEPSDANMSALLERLHTEFDYKIETAQFKFTSEQISTLIKRMLKLYELDGTAAPNLSLSKTISNLKSILYCRYRKGAMEDWTTTLVTTVRDSDVLQHALFKELVHYRDLEYAAVLYQHVQPKLNILPEELQQYIASTILPSVSKEEEVTSENTDQEEEVQVSQPDTTTSKNVIREGILPTDPVVSNGYVGLPPNVSIFDVDSPTSLRVCKDVLSSASVIGFDSEWQALLDPTKASPVALVQLSTHNTAFLLDISRILEFCSDDLLTEFVEDVFTEDVVLVGYSLHQDFTKLSETCQVMGTKIRTHKNVVDLAIAHKHHTRAERIRRSHEIRELVREGKPLPQSDSVSRTTGLARLCEMMFSYPLDKTYQISDWTRRPLFPDQRIYAALDAFILLPLYYKLTQTFHPTPLLDLTVNVSEIPEECKVVASYMPASSQPTPSYMLRVIVDVPCQGLGKKLRHLGVDCVILEDTQSIDDAAKISLAEGRIILSRDGNCDKLVKLTDPGRVYKVVGKNATTQLAEVRNHFNLVVEEEDLFSRCAICNCPYFLTMEPEQAKALKAAQGACNSSTVEQMYDVYDRRKNFVETISVTSDGMTQYGVKLQLHKVKISKFSETKTFWGCYDCGKMYWEGCHLQNFKEKHNL